MIRDLIEKAIKENKITLGEGSVENMLKHGELASVIIASNCFSEKQKILKDLCVLNKAEFLTFEGDSKDLGVACKKPFNINIIGIKKSGSKK